MYRRGLEVGITPTQLDEFTLEQYTACFCNEEEGEEVEITDAYLESLGFKKKPA